MTPVPSTHLQLIAALAAMSGTYARVVSVGGWLTENAPAES